MLTKQKQIKANTNYIGLCGCLLALVKNFYLSLIYVLVCNRNVPECCWKTAKQKTKKEKTTSKTKAKQKETQPLMLQERMVKNEWNKQMPQILQEQEWMNPNQMSLAIAYEHH